MNDTIGFYSNADTINGVIANDSSDYVLCTINPELYSDFRFITEQTADFGGPKERDVSFVSAGWNFVILFLVMILLVVNKFFAPNKFASIIAMPYQNGGSEKMIRDNHNFFNMISISIVVSSVLLISMLVQKFFLVYGSNYILHDNLDFFMKIATAVTAAVLINYLMMSFYSWLFKSYELLLLYVSLHISTMAISNVFFIPLVMVLLFYPYKYLLVACLVLFLILYTTRFAKLLIEIRLSSRLSFVNIFLYLCTIGILPLMVVSKMLVDAV